MNVWILAIEQVKKWRIYWSRNRYHSIKKITSSLFWIYILSFNLFYYILIFFVTYVSFYDIWIIKDNLRYMYYVYCLLFLYVCISLYWRCCCCNKILMLLLNYEFMKFKSIKLVHLSDFWLLCCCSIKYRILIICIPESFLTTQ